MIKYLSNYRYILIIAILLGFVTYESEQAFSFTSDSYIKSLPVQPSGTISGKYCNFAIGSLRGVNDELTYTEDYPILVFVKFFFLHKRAQPKFKDFLRSDILAAFYNRHKGTYVIRRSGGQSTRIYRIQPKYKNKEGTRTDVGDFCGRWKLGDGGLVGNSKTDPNAFMFTLSDDEAEYYRKWEKMDEIINLWGKKLKEYKQEHDDMKVDGSSDFLTKRSRNCFVFTWQKEFKDDNITPRKYFSRSTFHGAVFGYGMDDLHNRLAYVKKNFRPRMLYCHAGEAGSFCDNGPPMNKAHLHYQNQYWKFGGHFFSSYNDNMPYIDNEENICDETGDNPNTDTYNTPIRIKIAYNGGTRTIALMFKIKLKDIDVLMNEERMKKYINFIPEDIDLDTLLPIYNKGKNNENLHEIEEGTEIEETVEGEPKLDEMNGTPTVGTNNQASMANDISILTPETQTNTTNIQASMANDISILTLT